MPKTAFRYPLEAVKKKYRWDADLARQDLQQAVRLVEQAKARLDAAEAVLAAAEDAVRAVLSADAGFDPSVYAAARAYAAVQRRSVEAEFDVLRRSQRLHQQTLAHYQHTKRQCQVLDKHEERLRVQAIDVEQGRQQRESDEMCLLRWKYGV
jgi:hypothetical protein